MPAFNRGKKSIYFRAGNRNSLHNITFKMSKIKSQVTPHKKRLRKFNLFSKKKIINRCSYLSMKQNTATIIDHYTCIRMVKI